MPVITRTDHDAVATLVLTRPPVNALDSEALDAVGAAIEQVESDPHVRVVVLASGVESVFCAGGDLKFWRRFPAGMARDVSGAGRNVFERIERLRQPTIAAIEGHVIGDGLALALAADLRIASEAATFRVPEAEYGFIPGWGVPGRLRRQMGQALALEMLLTGAPIAASRAHALGLVTQVVPPGQALAAASRMAGALARKSPLALTWSKRVIRRRRRRRPRVGGGVLRPRLGERGLAGRHRGAPVEAGAGVRRPRRRPRAGREAMIALDEFKRLNLRVGEIVGVTPIPGPVRLLRVEVDLGDERRVLVAGLAMHYTPEALRGLQVVVLANLEAAVIHGVESQGMLLGVGCVGAAPALLTVNRPVPNGTTVQ